MSDLVDRNARKGQKPSDHAPVLALFDQLNEQGDPPDGPVSRNAADESDSDADSLNVPFRVELLRSLELTPRRAEMRQARSGRP